MHYVVVGNGVCGLEAALALRGRDAQDADHARLRRARSLLLAARSHVRLRGPDHAPGHRALRSESLRADGVREGEPPRRVALRRGEDAAPQGRRPTHLRQAPPRDGLARPARPLAGGRGPRRPLLRHPARPRSPGSRGEERRPGRGRRRRADRRRGGRDPAQSRAPRLLRSPGELVLSPRPRSQRGRARHRPPARPRHRRTPRRERRGDRARGERAAARRPPRERRRGRVRPRGLRHRRGAQHDVPGGLRPLPFEGGRHRGGRRPAHERSPTCGRPGTARTSRGPTDRGGPSSSGTRLATRAASPPARCSATTSPTAAAPGTTPPSSSTSSTRPRAGSPCS